jgi:hypothetical protein
MPGKRGISFVAPRQSSGAESPPPPPPPSPYSYSIVRPEVEKLSTWYSFQGEEPDEASPSSAGSDAVATGETTLTPADVFAPDSVRKRASARLAVRRLINGKVSTCWNSWAAMAAEQRKAIGQLRKSLKFLVNRKVALAFMSWRAVLEASLAEPEPEAVPMPEPEPGPETETETETEP